MPTLADFRRSYSFSPAHDGKHKYIATEKNTGRSVMFGDINYQQYKDRLGHYSSLDHHDEKRRESFRIRSNRFKDDIGSAGWFAYHLLW